MALVVLGFSATSNAGFQLQGFQLQGFQLQGFQLQGFQLQGTEAANTWLQGETLSGVIVDGQTGSAVSVELSSFRGDAGRRARTKSDHRGVGTE